MFGFVNPFFKKNGGTPPYTSAAPGSRLGAALVCRMVVIIVSPGVFR